MAKLAVSPVEVALRILADELAHQHDTTDQLIALAAELLAERAGMRAEDPEPQIAATALIGLWRIQFQSLRKHLSGSRAPARIHAAVTADVRRAAQLVDTGLGRYFSSGSAHRR